MLRARGIQTFFFCASSCCLCQFFFTKVIGPKPKDLSLTLAPFDRHPTSRSRRSVLLILAQTTHMPKLFFTSEKSCVGLGTFHLQLLCNYSRRLSRNPSRQNFASFVDWSPLLRPTLLMLGEAVNLIYGWIFSIKNSFTAV
jgi:hypothetical protein